MQSKTGKGMLAIFAQKGIRSRRGLRGLSQDPLVLAVSGFKTPFMSSKGPSKKRNHPQTREAREEQVLKVQ